jgi:Bax protein
MIFLAMMGYFWTSLFNSKEVNLKQDDSTGEALVSEEEAEPITEEAQEVQEVEQNSFTNIAYDSYKDWERLLEEYNYNINQELVEIPRVKVEKFPEDIGEISDVAKKKKIFLSIILIGAYHVNQDLIEDRRRLQSIAKQYSISDKIGLEDEEWLNQLKKEYSVKSDDLQESLDLLLVKVDIIPLSLVLAQAACESGWGTSRFTRVANNIFGEWTFSKMVAGVVPKDRPVNATYKIRKFDTIEESIKSYINNLNSHYAYEELWKIRANLREREERLDSLKLAEGLLNYSQRRELYIDELRDIIKYNNLQKLDSLLEE